MAAPFFAGCVLLRSSSAQLAAVELYQGSVFEVSILARTVTDWLDSCLGSWQQWHQEIKAE